MKQQGKFFIDHINEAQWLKSRRNFLTGSEAASYCSQNPYDANAALHLWEEKTGQRQPEDISGKAAVVYGKKAEEHLRALFLLFHTEYECEYHKYGIYINPHRPYMGATLDGLLADRQTKEKIILEIKTTTLHNSEALRNWLDGQIPIQYYCQILHQLHCLPQAHGVVVFAQIKTEWNPEQSTLVEHLFRREAVPAEDMEWVLAKADKMYHLIQTRKRPATMVSL